VNARCVIGIGCDDHGDQIAGLLVARRIAAIAPGDVTVHECSGAPEQLVAAWQGAGETVVVEAMPGPVPGVVSRCQPHPRPLAGGCSPTRLSPDLREALALGPLPERVTVITIAAQRFASSAGVSPEVALSAHRVASAILDDWSVPTIAGQSAVAVPAGV
jgi:hydrogenase maturation protease